MDEKKVKIRKVIEHVDLLGEPISLGNYVAVARHNSLWLCTIIKMTPKQMRVIPVKKGMKVGDGWLVYPFDTVKVEGENALAYILKH